MTATWTRENRYDNSFRLTVMKCGGPIEAAKVHERNDGRYEYHLYTVPCGLVWRDGEYQDNAPAGTDRQHLLHVITDLGTLGEALETVERLASERWLALRGYCLDFDRSAATEIPCDYLCASDQGDEDEEMP